MTNAQHAKFNAWRNTSAGALYCRLVLEFGRVRMERVTRPVRPHRRYVGGIGNVRFFQCA